MRGWGRLCSAGLLMVCGVAVGQEPAPVTKPALKVEAKRQVSFTFDRKGVLVSHYRLVVHDDGSGLYEGTEIPSATAYGHPASDSAQPFKHVITISPATSQKIFSTAEKLNRFDVPCASS